MMRNRVLIADDAGFIREILTRICESAGFEIVGEAIDGEDVVKKADLLRPGIILMDIVMPKKNGIEATKEILEKGIMSKVIACSTLGDEDFINQALMAGCVDFINKPFNRERVIEALTKQSEELKGVKSV